MADEVVGLSAHDHLRRPVAPYFKRISKSAYRTTRVVLDPILALSLLIVCLPLIAVIMPAIRLDSPGPAFFRQKRAGRDGKPFTIVKFRTLHLKAPSYSLKVADDDPMVTNMGRLLRRTGLDELPQLWNVIRGEMAIIGPRPEQIELIELYEQWQDRRHQVKPGITGWWQIHHRDGVPLHHNIDKDLYYIHNQGPWIDLLIVLGTLRIVWTGLLIALSSNSRKASRVALVDSVSNEGETPKS